MQLPGPVRAFVGLLAVTAEEAKHLPDRAIELPMLAVSSALQVSLRAQQRYARLAARGDDVLNRRSPGDEAPPWATFDDPVSVEELRGAGLTDPDPALRARAAGQLLDELLGVTNDTPRAPDEVPAPKVATAEEPAKKAPARKVAAKKAAANKAAANKAAANKAAANQVAANKIAAKKTAAARKAAARKTAAPAARKQPVKKVNTAEQVSAAEQSSGSGPGKTINSPRHTTPSRFDTVEDD